MAERTESLNILISAKDRASKTMRQVNAEVNTLNRSLAGGVGARGGLLGGVSGASGLFGRLGMAALPELTALIVPAQIALNGLLSVAGFVGDALKRMGEFAVESLRKVAIGAGVAAAALVGVGVSAIQAASQVQSAEIGFTTMTKSAEAAKELVASLQAFSAQTPFQFQSLLQIARPLMAFGFQAKEIIPTLRDIGDAIGSLGGGSEGLERVVRALGQVKAKGRLQMEEVLQFAEAGIPIFDILTQKLQLTGNQMQQLGRQGIAASTAIPAILAGLRERFGGGMASQMATVAGKASNLADSFFNLRAAAGRALLPLAGVFVDFASNALGALQPLGQALSSALASPQVIAAVQGWVTKLGEGLQGRIVGAIQWLITNGPKLGESIVSGLNQVIGAAGVAWGYLKSFGATAIQVAKSAAAAIGGFINNLFDPVTLHNLATSVLTPLGQIVIGVGAAFHAAALEVLMFVDGIKAMAAYGRRDFREGYRLQQSALARPGQMKDVWATALEQSRGLNNLGNQMAAGASRIRSTISKIRTDMQTAGQRVSQDSVVPALQPGVAYGTGYALGMQQQPVFQQTNNFYGLQPEGIEEQIESGTYRAMRKATAGSTYLG